MPKIEYDSEVKILKIRLSNKKSVDSDIKNNVVLDYDAQGNVVNIDVMQVGLEDIVTIYSKEKHKKNKTHAV